MGCPKRQQSGEKIREIVRAMHARGDHDGAFFHKFMQCCRASTCHRLCPRLVKGPGVSEVYCVDVESGERVHLYPALASPEFVCPEGFF